MERSMTQPTSAGKCAVYTACLHETQGYLAIIDRALLFMDAETGDTAVITPDDVNWLTTYGRVGEPTARILRGLMRGQHDHLCVQHGS